MIDMPDAAYKESVKFTTHWIEPFQDGPTIDTGYWETTVLDPFVFLFDCIPFGRGDSPEESIADCVRSYRSELADCQRYCELESA